jgi:peptide/nickel transport system ATP-binding protein
MSVLSIRDLSITYHTQGGGVPAVRGVSLDIDKGEVLGLAGESGCGKSTIAAGILRLLPARTKVEGEILLARVGSLLEQVGLPSRRIRDYPHELSGGQKQRVMIAMALACAPNLVIADEPTTALDVMVQAQVLALLKNLQRELGLAMLFITHDLSVLVEVSDRLAIMYAGKIVEEGPARDVFERPTHPYSRALAAAFPTIGDARFRHRPSGLGGDPPDPQAIPSGCPFHPRCPDVFEPCPTVEPDLYAAGEGRRAACLLVEGALASVQRAIE